GGLTSVFLCVHLNSLHDPPSRFHEARRRCCTCPRNLARSSRRPRGARLSCGEGRGAPYRDAMRQRRGAMGAALATAALVLLAWAAAGPVVVLDPELEIGGDRREGPDELPSGDQTPMPALDPLAGPGADVRVRWDIVADVVGVLLLVLLAAALWRVWRWWRGRRTDRSLPDEEDVDADLLLRATGSQA